MLHENLNQDVLMSAQVDIPQSSDSTYCHQDWHSTLRAGIWGKTQISDCVPNNILLSQEVQNSQLPSTKQLQLVSLTLLYGIILLDFKTKLKFLHSVWMRCPHSVCQICLAVLQQEAKTRSLNKVSTLLKVEVRGRSSQYIRTQHLQWRWDLFDRADGIQVISLWVVA